MPHVVDRNAVKQIELGPCECPNTPHPVDFVRLSLRYSYMDKMGLADAFGQGVEAASRYRFLKRVKDWNFVDEKGRKLPISQATLSDLDEATATKVWEAIDKVDNDARDGDDLPNP